MPFYLKSRDLPSDLDSIRSVLIVPCRFCPAASLAVRERAPYLEPFRSLLRTRAYEAHIRGLKAELERRGHATEVFGAEFVMCMWTAGCRRRLAKRAARHQALLVLGCEAALETARQSTAGSGCRVIGGMEVEGVMNVVPRFRLPFDVWLDVRSVTVMTSAGTHGPTDPL